MIITTLFLICSYISIGTYIEFKGKKNKYFVAIGDRNESRYKDIKRAIKWELLEYIAWTIASFHMLCSYLLFGGVTIGAMEYTIYGLVIFIIVGRLIIAYKNDKDKMQERIIKLIIKILIYAIWFKIFIWRAFTM